MHLPLFIQEAKAQIIWEVHCGDLIKSKSKKSSVSALIAEEEDELEKPKKKKALGGVLGRTGRTILNPSRVGRERAFSGIRTPTTTLRTPRPKKF